MQHSQLQALRKRAFQYTRKRDLVRLMRHVTAWDEDKINLVLRHRRDLIRLKHGQRRRNGDPSSSHENFIQVSLLLDGWTKDHYMSALAWSHDKHDDYPEKFGYRSMTRGYSVLMAIEVSRLSRDGGWRSLPFRDEVNLSDLRIRSGGERTMGVKIPDSIQNLANPLRITSERRRRKSGMKLWQKLNSIASMAEDLDYMKDEFTFLTNREFKRLGYTYSELDDLVKRPLDNP